MIFHDKYELLALRGGDRDIALPGREISSGRDVLVHLLAAGYTPENREVLAAIDRLPGEYRLRVLDKGDHEGIPYLVTEVLPANLKLREWLAKAQSAVPAPKPAASPGRSGAWRIQADTEATRQTTGMAPEPGEFTRMFQAVKEPEQGRPTVPKPDDLPVVAMPTPTLGQPVVQTPAAPEPGEFTRLFQAVIEPEQGRPSTPKTDDLPTVAMPMLKLDQLVVQTPAAPPAALAAEPEPGEFTRMFQAVKEPKPGFPSAPKPDDLPVAAVPMPKLDQPAAEISAAPPTSPAAGPEPGEFTRMLRAAALPPPAVTPAEEPTAPAAGPEPGEFTRMLHAAAAPPAIATPSVTPTAQSRTTRAAALSPAVTPAAIQSATSADPEPPASPVAFSTSATMPAEASAVPEIRSGAAPLPAATPAAPPAPIPAEPEPGEFTRLLRAVAPPPLVVTPSETPAATTAGPEPGEFTRMFQAPTPAGQAPAKTSSSPPAPRPTAPGEFTRMMQSPLAAEPLRAQPAAAPAQSASEFTRMMQAGRLNDAPAFQAPLPGPAATPPPPSRAPQTPGEFTRMFATDPRASDNLAMPAAPQAPMPQGGLATGAFSRRAASTPPPVASGPSEFTQMFAAPPQADAALAPAPKPAAPPAPKAEKSSLTLILVLAGLFLLVVIVIVVFALTR